MAWISRYRLRLSAIHLRQGGILAYPTEAVFGLGCDPFNATAVEEVLSLKGRSAAKGFILIAADFTQIEPFLDIPQDMLEKLLATWPGPVTWIVPARQNIPKWLRGKHDTLAVRVTAHPVASALCKAFGGAIVSTSANPSGMAPARTRMKARKYFKGAGLHFMPGQVGGQDKPTAIFDAKTGARLR